MKAIDILETISEQNAHLLDNAFYAYSAALDLAKRGYTLQAIRIGDRNPLVRIKGERRCRHLNGAIRMINGSGAGRRTMTMTAIHKDVQIEWEQ